MNLLKIFVTLVLIGGGSFLLKSYQPLVSISVPTQSILFIDDKFSLDFKAELKAFIADCRSTESSDQQVLEQVAESFPEIVDMSATICKLNKRCFSFDGAEPLFILNGESIVCENGAVVDSKHYEKDFVQDLAKVKARYQFGINNLVSFMKKVPKEIFKEFDLFWEDEDKVELKSKDKGVDSLIFSNEYHPELKDISAFRKIKGKNSGFRKKKLFDFRFKDQIVVRG